MKSALSLLLATLALTAWVSADVPAKAPPTKYRTLWENSPFTSKPPPPEDGPVANPLEDYALGGVSPITGGYRVTLLNKKKPEERITVDTDNPKSGFKILSVTRKSGDPLGTIVRMSSGALTGTVAFDEKLLTIAAPPAAAKPQPGQPNLPGQPPIPGMANQINNPNGQPGVPQRQPRPRVVPPPTPQGQPQQVNPAGANPRPERRRDR
jgi:hypothetical protein